jgi:hypothetical protein
MGVGNTKEKKYDESQDAPFDSSNSEDSLVNMPETPLELETPDSSRPTSIPSVYFEKSDGPVPKPKPKIIPNVPTIFNWRHGGEEAYVSGSFNDWAGKVQMIKDELGEFSLILPIPVGTYRYRYVVDGVWRVNPDHCVEIDEDGDDSNLLIVDPMFEPEAISSLEGFHDSDDESIETDSEGKKISYGQSIPDDLVGKMLQIPPHLTKTPNLATIAPLTPLEDPNALSIPDYVTLNHIYAYHSDRKDRDVMITAVTKRLPLSGTEGLRAKYVTTIFYAPTPSSETSSLASSGTHHWNGLLRTR